MSQERLYKVLLAPHISEKAAMAAEYRNQYVFKVATDANKAEIKAAVETIYNVGVDKVTTVNVKGKEKRFGRFVGRRKNWKKAYVSLTEGQSIDFTGGE